jgi:hypothetical protein
VWADELVSALKGLVGGFGLHGSMHICLCLSANTILSLSLVAPYASFFLPRDMTRCQVGAGWVGSMHGMMD